MAEIDDGNLDHQDNMNNFPQHDHIPQIGSNGGGQLICGICGLVIQSM